MGLGLGNGLCLQATEGHEERSAVICTKASGRGGGNTCEDSGTLGFSSGAEADEGDDFVIFEGGLRGSERSSGTGTRRTWSSFAKRTSRPVRRSADQKELVKESGRERTGMSVAGRRREKPWTRHVASPPCIEARLVRGALTAFSSQGCLVRAQRRPGNPVLARGLGPVAAAAAFRPLCVCPPPRHPRLPRRPLRVHSPLLPLPLPPAQTR